MRNAATLVSLCLLACSGGEAAVDAAGTGLTLGSQLSECGGFERPDAAPTVLPLPAYCDAEVLTFTHAGGTLSLSNERVLLNCCGDHSMTVRLEEGTYVVTEIDAPEAAAGGARCGCMCVFDFAVEAGPIAAGTIAVRLVRDVTDDDAAPWVVWEGDLDLTAGSGTITVDTSSVEGWCP